MSTFQDTRRAAAFPMRTALFVGAMLAMSVSAAADATQAMLDMSLEQLMNIVTSRKREENVIDIPVSVTSFSEQTLGDYNIRSFADYASKTPNLSFAYGNALTAGNPSTGWSSARTIAIRGVSGARTSGFYVDDIPIPGSVDIHVADMKSIEVLKGPQGTLFGESSMGGNIRLTTNVPNLAQGGFGYRVQAGQTQAGGRQNAGVEAVGNLVLSQGVAALRMAVHTDDFAGYLTRSYLSDITNPLSARISVDNQGAQRNVVGSVTGLIRPNANLDLSIRLMYGDQQINGFPATWAPLPAFEPQYSMQRLANLQSQVSDTWTLPSFLLTYRGQGWTLNSSTSRFERRARDLEDSTEGTLQLSPATPLQPFAWPSVFESHQLAHETRIAFSGAGRLSGTIGIFYSKHQTHYAILPVFDTISTPPVLMWEQTDDNTQQNLALFGELYYKFMDRWTLTLGDRMYRLRQEDTQKVIGDAGNTTYYDQTASNGHSPKVALAYQPSDSAMLYGSATKGFRQGNAQLDASAFGACASSLAAIGETAASLKTIKPDSLWSYEVGGKFALPETGLLLTASAFHIDWRDVQQQLLLQSCGLFIQGNAGDAKVDGVELELSGRLTPLLRLRLGLGYEDARITRQGNTGQAVGDRVYQAPQWTASVGGVWSRRLNERLTASVAADYSYTGDSMSANNGPLNLRRSGYGLVNVRTRVNWDKSELALDIKNLGNAQPNLGDITYIGYGLFTDATRTIPIPQVATLRPRTIMLQYLQRF